MREKRAELQLERAFSELGAESGTMPAESKSAFLPVEAPGHGGHPAFQSAPQGGGVGEGIGSGGIGSNQMSHVNI